MITERLYYHDSMLLTFDATVIGFDAGDHRRVILDRTAFYPTSGGQPHDVGTLGGIDVIEVIDADDTVVHVLAAPLSTAAVYGQVDEVRRRDFMVQHTAQHLISAIAADRLGWSTVSVHFGDLHSSIEFDTAAVSDVEIEDLQRWTNDAIGMALPVSVSMEEPDVAVERGLRKPPPREGTIRVITIQGIDRSACGGTHVANIASLAPVMVRAGERVRGHQRVEFMAGARAWRSINSAQHLLTSLTAELSCSIDELADLVPRRTRELLDLRDRVNTLETEVGASRWAALLQRTEPDASGRRTVVWREPTGSIATMRAMASAATKANAAVFVGIIAQPPTLVVASSPDSGCDAGASLKTALAAVGGRGGGSARMAQGMVPDASLLDVVLNQLT